MKPAHLLTQRRLFIVTAHDLVWSMDINGVGHSLMLHTIYGYEPAGTLNTPLAILQTPKSKKADDRAFKMVIEGNDLLGYENDHFSLVY